MDRLALIQLLVRPGLSDRQQCMRLSANKYIAVSDWKRLRQHEAEFLRCYAIGAGSRSSVLVGRSAAMIHGMWTLPQRDAPVLLAHPRPMSKKHWTPGANYIAAQVPQIDVIQFTPGGTTDTLRVTSAARTAIDVARIHGVRHGVVAMDSLFAMLPTQAEKNNVRAEMEAVAGRLRGKRGIDKARQAIAWSSMRSESPYESVLRVMLREHGVKVQEQMWIGKYVRPDLLWDQLVIEVDGESKFDEDPKQAALDQLQRENWLRAQLYECVRFNPRDILRDEATCMRVIGEMKKRSELLGEPKVAATAYRPEFGTHWRHRGIG